MYIFQRQKDNGEQDGHAELYEEELCRIAIDGVITERLPENPEMHVSRNSKMAQGSK